MSNLDLDAIVAQLSHIESTTCPYAVAQIGEALVARVRELEAQLQGLDYRAHPDHYRHNLQRAEEAAAEYLAALEAARAENDRLRAELEQAENAAFCECGRVRISALSDEVDRIPDLLREIEELKDRVIHFDQMLYIEREELAEYKARLEYAIEERDEARKALMEARK